MASTTLVATDTHARRAIFLLALLALLFTALALATAGCNTVKGVGEDIKSAGEAGQRVIDEN